ncbi:GTP-binding protein [Symbiobacterium terraclitae]|uniref:GTPase Obg n=1 Tax=Symbiobacterium terraclitae TaxID=557451 RepID=A0ABS4JWP8_9FIRM|nr:GTPase ObgE [Symbiobacterium terraclitae]MBP2019944.1 GTP-binding protein [Symbiobacterium terraclitae]
MFVDVARIYVKGGDGGRGSNSVRREKYIPEGGPWGGDGGRGGNVVFVVDPGLNTLVDFKYQKHFKAERGEHGGTKGMHGRKGEDLVVKVPPGTVVKDDDTGEVLFDLVEPGQRVVVARGGRGGRGNMRFATPTNKCPTFYEKGEPGEERWLLLELKVVADVGLVGFPNAGKSTFLSAVSAARPKIANYPFTTLNPVLGVVEVGDGRSFVIADIPGLIEGAHQGVGLGHEFLRHVERTKVLIHVLDGAGTEGRDPLQDFDVIQHELRAYNPELADRPTLVAFNKMDLPEARENLPRVQAELEARGYRVFPISGATREGFRPLLAAAADLIAAWQPPEPAAPAEEKVYRPKEDDWRVYRYGGVWHVEGKEIERLVAMTMWENDEAVSRFLKILKLKGVERALREAGAEDGDTVRVYGIEFELTDDPA